MNESETGNNSRVRELAQAAARLGEEFVMAVRTNQIEVVRELLQEGSTASYLFTMFGLALFRLDLRLDEPTEAGKLAPYDLQFEGEVALLELGVLEPVEAEGEQHGHLRRLFGSSLLLNFSQQWQIVEVLPFNSDGTLTPQNQPDKYILEIHHGKSLLPLQIGNLDQTEQAFLNGMQQQTGQFNLEELVNALRLWRYFKSKSKAPLTRKTDSWAGAVEYLITLFDYHEADSKAIARRYKVTNTAVLNRARELAQTLGVTQFDDRYSVHPDPTAHYRRLFGELGVQPERDERIRLAQERERVFDSIEVPPDDDDFFGPT